MLTVFNRKLLFSTNHHETYANNIELLIANGIKYTSKSFSETSRHVMARSYPGTNKRAYTGVVYYVYVHKKDYSRAVKIINSRNI